MTQPQSRIALQKSLSSSGFVTRQTIFDFVDYTPPGIVVAVGYIIEKDGPQEDNNRDPCSSSPTPKLTAVPKNNGKLEKTVGEMLWAVHSAGCTNWPIAFLWDGVSLVIHWPDNGAWTALCNTDGLRSRLAELMPCRDGRRVGINHAVGSVSKLQFNPDSGTARQPRGGDA